LPANNLLMPLESRRRSGLVLGKLLVSEADKMLYRGAQQDRAHAILKHWADLERGGHLARKETALDASFLQEVFSDALGYLQATKSPEDYQLERNFTIPEVGTADAALGNFRPGEKQSPLVVVELKGAWVSLDKDRFNGRTPVQQCWDYLNALPECPWGIVSNFITFRLYHRNKTPRAYEEFRLQELRELKRFREFYCLFERGGLVRPALGQPLRALHLVQLTENRQREVGDELYDKYSENRRRLIEHLHHRLGKTRDRAIHVAQKILDRIIFVAFCEDRGLLPAKCIDRAYSTLPPFSKVTNPRWRNFLDLFRAVDKGHWDVLGLDTGYDGGLFRHDPEVDDLQLDDDWTHFFRDIGTYDFRDEVNVDVLGHLFERSVAELETLRVGGLFAVEGPTPVGRESRPAMLKSAERKRFGIFYTPPDFTRFIVRQTVEEVIRERIRSVRESEGLSLEEVESEDPSPRLAGYWRRALEALRSIKICDPACGSGAFLIQAYDVLEHAYSHVAERLAVHETAAAPAGVPPELSSPASGRGVSRGLPSPVRGRGAGGEGISAEALEDAIPDIILAENLFGADLSPQAVEITQLALWLRSARRGKTLADLSHNIVWGNSLVTDASVDPHAVVWREAFPGIFGRPENPGFDCVVGNPPWERLKLQEREFFALSAPEIAGAVSAATRRRMIEQLEAANPELHAQYVEAQTRAEQTLAHVRASGNFPLTAKGDINTYMLFAELARTLVAPKGRVGLLVPSGIATDNTTREFFASLMDSKSLVSLYDFENKAPVFPDVHRSFKFCTLVFGGSGVQSDAADFVFFARRMDEIEERKRHIPLSSKDIALLNPNTRTCPIFRTRLDAELTKAIYRRVPILVDRSRKKGGNAWGIRFVTMFHQTNDAELFRTAEELAREGFRLDGNRWKKGKSLFLPLYEGKMVQAYDHRAASVVVEENNWFRQGQTEPTTLVTHQNPEFVVQPRWWVDGVHVQQALAGYDRQGCLCYKLITSPTNQRTMIAAMIPRVAVVNSMALLLTDEGIEVRRLVCLLANLNSIALDFVARQKIGGVNLNFFIVQQFPVFPPERYDDRCPWQKKQRLEKWISDRVLKLTCTADDMRPLAEAAGLDPPVHRWNPAERIELMAELDAAFFLLYSIERDDVEYILSTFQGIQGGEDDAARLFRTNGGILEAYDRLRGDC